MFKHKYVHTPPTRSSALFSFRAAGQKHQSHSIRNIHIIHSRTHQTGKSSNTVSCEADSTAGMVEF